MKIKTILFASLVGASLVVTAQAQPVYSVNAVGYYTISVPPGFTMIANQLVASNNTVSALFSSLPTGSAIYKWGGASFLINSFDKDLGWDDPNQTLVPGEGAFILNPTSTNISVTIPGEVGQGTLTNALATGFSIRSSKVPQSGLLQDSLGLTPPPNQSISVLRFKNGSYQFHEYDKDLGWDVQPNLSVGESFFILSQVSFNWSRSFNVNQ